MCRPGGCVNLTLLITVGLFLRVLLSRDHPGVPPGLGGLGQGTRLRLSGDIGQWSAAGAAAQVNTPHAF